MSKAPSSFERDPFEKPKVSRPGHARGTGSRNGQKCDQAGVRAGARALLDARISVAGFGVCSIAVMGASKSSACGLRHIHFLNEFRRKTRAKPHFSVFHMLNGV
jgi:hypothetical protein